MEHAKIVLLVKELKANIHAVQTSVDQMKSSEVMEPVAIVHFISECHSTEDSAFKTNATAGRKFSEMALVNTAITTAELMLLRLMNALQQPVMIDKSSFQMVNVRIVHLILDASLKFFADQMHVPVDKLYWKTVPAKTVQITRLSQLTNFNAIWYSAVIINSWL